MRDPYISDGTTREYADREPPTGPRRRLRPPGDPWVVVALVASGTALVVAVAGLIVAARAGSAGGGPAPGSAAAGSPAPVSPAPDVPTPDESESAKSPRPRGTARSGRPVPTATRLAWRSELLSDGSTRMVVGDVDAAPQDPERIGGSDYRAGADDKIKIVKVRGWWCATKVSATVSYSANYTARTHLSRLRSPGFWTRCAGRRPGLMRQRYGFQRSSWSGFRPYTGDQRTGWTGASSQSSGALSAPCPAGRTGTYDYRLSVTLEIGGRPIGPAAALSNDKYRGDCGTGVS